MQRGTIPRCPQHSPLLEYSRARKALVRTRGLPAGVACTHLVDADALLPLCWQLSDYKDPSSGLPLQKMTEESYFFRMSAYQQRLLDHIEANDDFIMPENRRNEILSKLKEPLRDLSVSRTTFDWGVPVPENPHLKSEKKHVMYVWFDALSNYLSACDFPNGPNLGYWPCSMHLIGKDIIWFHCVIWPCMLMSCGVDLPKTVYAHGFINDKDGKKMSKSLGNVVDPHEQLDKYSCDSFRFYMCYSSPFGSDIPFNEEALIVMHNAELAGKLPGSPLSCDGDSILS